MKKLLKALRRVRLVIQPSSPAIKVVALCAVVFSMLALLTIQSVILDGRAQNAALAEQAAQLELENQELQQYIDELGTVQSVQRIAEEELGLVDPDTIIITPQE